MFYGQNGEGASARGSDLESNALSIGVECWTVQPQNPSEKKSKKKLNFFVSLVLPYSSSL